MKKGEILEGVVEELQFPNKGILHADNRTITIKNSVPGQKVRYSVSKIRKDRAEGRLLEVTEKADYELEEPNCQHFGVCGGCSYQNLTYEKQLEIKEGQVKRLLDPVLKEDGRDFDSLFEKLHHSPKQFGYRNKMEFTFGDEVKDGPLALGMHKRGSFYDIVPVTRCQIIDEDYRKILSSTIIFFVEKGIPYYHRMRHDGILRHLLVRKAAKTGEILIDLVTAPSEEMDTVCSEYADMLLALELDGQISGILHTVNESLADVIKDDGTEILYGKDYIYEELLGLRFKISPFSFFQTNSLGAEVLYSVVRDFVALKDDPVVYDLYSGTGTIAQILSPAAGKVIGVEIVAEAVEAAKVNAGLNGLDNCEFICGDVLKALDDIETLPDFIVLDPPRDGIHPKALKKIIDYGVESMVYVSCKPTSLARDLVSLQAGGYHVEKIALVDMFPGTVHVETVVLMSRVFGSDK
jgi:23S rRNA (uracil1939-C5)-methyltransferase